MYAASRPWESVPQSLKVNFKKSFIIIGQDGAQSPSMGSCNRPSKAWCPPFSNVNKIHFHMKSAALITRHNATWKWSIWNYHYHFACPIFCKVTAAQTRTRTRGKGKGRGEKGSRARQQRATRLKPLPNRSQYLPRKLWRHGSAEFSGEKFLYLNQYRIFHENKQCINFSGQTIQSNLCLKLGSKVYKLL